MTRENVDKLITLLEYNYPNFHPKDKTVMINIWHELLKEYRDDEILMSAKTYIANDTSGFAPTTGKLINTLYNIKTSGSLNETQAWTLVERAARNGAYCSEEEFNKLPKIVQNTIGSASYLRGLANGNDESLAIERSTFYKRFRAQRDRERSEALLPDGAKKLLGIANRTANLLGGN